MLSKFLAWLDSLTPRTYYSLVFQWADSTEVKTVSLYYGLKGRRLNLSLNALGTIKKENGVPPSAVFLSAFPIGRMRPSQMTFNAKSWPYLDSDKAKVMEPWPNVSLDTISDWAEFRSLVGKVLGTPHIHADYSDCRKLRAYIAELEEHVSELSATQCRAFYGDDHGHPRCRFEDAHRALKSFDYPQDDAAGD